MKDSEFFVLSTLEKYPNFRLAALGPRPMTWLSKTSQNKKRRPLFSKNVLKIVPIHVYKFSFFNTSNIYRVFCNYFDRAETARRRSCRGLEETVF